MRAEEIKTLTDAQRFVESLLYDHLHGVFNDQQANDIMGDYTKRMLQMGAEMYKKTKEK